MEPTPAEIRVLGSLIEKQRTTPDQYPLSINALRLACNQTTNRDPVVSYDDQDIRDALARLRQRGWTRYASAQGSRTAKYRHLLDEALGLARDELALLAALMLRGPQTPGELKQRTERMHPFAGLAEVEETIDRLIERDLVVRQRRPGQKEDRFAQVLGGAAVPEEAPAAEREDPPAPAEASAPPAPAASDPPTEGLDVLAARVAALEAAIRELREELVSLRSELGG